MSNIKTLADWLISECDQRGLAWSEVCRRAGVSPNTISDAVNGTKIGPRRLLKLAAYFRVDPQFLMQLAGVLPAAPWTPPPKAARESRLDYLVDRLAKLTPSTLHRYIDAALVLLEWAEAADRANLPAEEHPQ